MGVRFGDLPVTQSVSNDDYVAVLSSTDDTVKLAKTSVLPGGGGGGGGGSIDTELNASSNNGIANSAVTRHLTGGRQYSLETVGNASLGTYVKGQRILFANGVVRVALSDIAAGDTLDATEWTGNVSDLGVPAANLTSLRYFGSIDLSVYDLTDPDQQPQVYEFRGTGINKYCDISLLWDDPAKDIVSQIGCSVKCGTIDDPDSGLTVTFDSPLTGQAPDGTTYTELEFTIVVEEPFGGVGCTVANVTNINNNNN